MLKLENVSKTYLSKSKNQVRALNDINLQFPTTGMVFVLGKSGSGKSTLLNIIGGLDKPTTGEIFYNGESLKDFQRSDYDNYRNSVIGFVFQEFNLLKDLNVKNNVALSLQVSKEDSINEKVISSLQAVGLDENYLKRRIDELSGGEKQRVAIARVIAKQSKIILADEPTGNLDGETGKEVWQIFKNLSKTQLVVVVSHDEESAYNYADRIIKISDGKIVDDEIIENKTVFNEISDDNAKTEVCFNDAKAFSTDENTFEKSDDRVFQDNKRSKNDSGTKGKKGKKSKKLSNAVCLKLGFNNLRLRVSKTVSIILLSVFSVFSLLLSQMFIMYSTEEMITRFVNDNDVRYFQVVQGKNVKNAPFETRSVSFYDDTLQYLYDNADCISDGRIESAQDIFDFGLSFKGETLPLTNDSFFITDFALENAYGDGRNNRFGVYINENGKITPIIKEVHTPEKIVGKRMQQSRQNGESYLVAGVVDTSCLTEVQRGGLPKIFHLNTFLGQGSRMIYVQRVRYFSLNVGESSYTEDFILTGNLNSKIDSILTTKGFLKKDAITNKFDMELKEDEIVLSYELFSYFEDLEKKDYYLKNDFTEIELPKLLDTYQDINVTHKENGELFLDMGKYKIVGVLFTSENAFSTMRIGVMHKSNVVNYYNRFFPYYSVAVRTDSIDDLQAFLKTFRKNYRGGVTNLGLGFSGLTYEMEYDLEYYYAPVLIAFSVALLIILFFLVVSLISYSILQRRKEIGILSALGMGNKDISKIFFFESGLISLLTIILAGVLIVFAAHGFNCLLVVIENALLTPYLHADSRVFIGLVIFATLPVFLATLLPLRKLFKLKPVDAIREV